MIGIDHEPPLPLDDWLRLGEGPPSALVGAGVTAYECAGAPLWQRVLDRALVVIGVGIAIAVIVGFCL